MKRLRKKSFRGEGLRKSTYPRVRKMFRVERPWVVVPEDKKTDLRRWIEGKQWARERAANTFVHGTMVDPQSDSVVAGLSYPGGRPPCSQEHVMVEVSSRFRDPRLRKAFIRIVRKLFLDAGISVVGPVPVMILQKIWVHFGEEHFTAHGRACWCRLCRSVGPARFTFVQDLMDSLVTYLVKMPVVLIRCVLVPAPLKTAYFVANKVWQWLKAILG